jgi:Tfp pilus assembly protein PilO
MINGENTFHRGSWLVTILLVAIAFVHIVFVYFPERRSLGRLRNEIDYRNRYINDAADAAKQLAEAQQELVEVKSYVDNWRNKAAAVHRLPVLYGDIYKLSKQTGTTATRFEPQIVVKLGTIRQIPIHMAFNGTFSEIFDFISSVEKLPQTIWIDSLRLDKTGKDGQHISGEVNIVVFSDNPNISNYIDGHK